MTRRWLHASTWSSWAVVAVLVIGGLLSAAAFQNARADLERRIDARVSRQVDRTMRALESHLESYRLLMPLTLRPVATMLPGQWLEIRSWQPELVAAASFHAAATGATRLVPITPGWPDVELPDLEVMLGAAWAPPAHSADVADTLQLRPVAVDDRILAMILIPHLVDRSQAGVFLVDPTKLRSLIGANRDRDIAVDLVLHAPNGSDLDIVGSTGDSGWAPSSASWFRQIERPVPGSDSTVVARFVPLATFATSQRIGTPWGILGVGLVLTALSSLVAWALLRVHGRAVELADQLTHERTAALTRLRAHLENTPLAAIEIDRDFQVASWNPAAERIFGHRASRIVGRSAAELFESEDAAMLFRSAVRSRPATGLEVANRRADGRRIDCLWYATPLEDGAGPVAALVQDVTEQRQLAERARENQKMEAVGRLAGGVAHDFNNILTAILGYTDLQLHSTDDPRVVEHAREIRNAAERAAGLTRQLLAFSRRSPSEPVVVDLNRLVEGTETMLRRLLTENMTLATDLDPDLWPVRVDPNQIEQVVVNLAVNARDAMPSGGRVVLRTANLATQDGDRVVLEVVDDGVGMTPEVAELAFEPFFTTKESGRGTGLGLATVYGIIHQAGGTVRLDTRPGAGTTVQIELPRSAGMLHAESGAGLGPEEPGGAGEVVLMVEDDPAVRQLTREMLESAGFRAVVAEDAEQALALAEQPDMKFDMLLSDVILPGMTGPELAAILRRQKPGLPVLFMSGYPDDQLGRHGIVDEGVHLLGKPFGSRTLVRRIREVLGQPPS